MILSDSNFSSKTFDKHPPVSICMPMVKADSRIDETITSLTNQTYKNFDLIICGRVDTLNYAQLNALRQKLKLTIVPQASANETSIHNTLLSLSSGKYVKFILPESILDANCIEMYVQTFERYETLAMVTAPVRCLYDDSKKTSKVLSPEFIGYRSGKSVVEKALHTLDSPVGNLSNVMFRKDFAQEGFNGKFDSLADMELWLKVLAYGDCVSLSRPLLYAPFFEPLAKRNTRLESLQEIYDCILLQEAQINKLVEKGITGFEAYNKAFNSVEDRFVQICHSRALTKEGSAYAARKLAETLDRDSLIELVVKFNELTYSSMERIVSLRRQHEPKALDRTEDSPEKDEALAQLSHYRDELRKEYRALGNSISWRVTEPLRLANSALVSAEASSTRRRMLPLITEIAKQTAKRRRTIFRTASKTQAPLPALRHEVEELEREISSIRESRSWKVSKFLRQLRSKHERKTIRPASLNSILESIDKHDIDADLLVFDDTFPNKLSAFRYAEYSEYLKSIPNCHVIRVGETPVFYGANKEYKDVLEEYYTLHPSHSKRIHEFTSAANISAKLAYCVFLSLAHDYLPHFENLNLPFVFTLYPGGCFEMNQPNSDAMLKRVMSSPLFQKVIVSQRIVKNYLLANKFCKENQIEEIIGCVTLDNSGLSGYEKQYFGIDKSTKDICFVAHKYHAQGHDKGYDVFIDLAKELSKRRDDVYFHVVGGFEAKDIDICGIEDRIRFYGALEHEELQSFYLAMDAIVSPNIHGKVSPGRFDGFPTGCCMEAGLLGVVPFCTDFLNQNVLLDEGKDFISIDRNPSSIANSIEPFLNDMERLYDCSKHVRQTFSRVYGYDAQLEPRIKVITDVLDGQKKDPKQNRQPSKVR